MNPLQELVLELNTRQDCEENPTATSGDWQFSYATDGEIHQIRVNDSLVYSYDPKDDEMTRCDLLERIGNELEDGEECLKSAIWIVRKLLQEERADVRTPPPARNAKKEYLVLDPEDVRDLRHLLVQLIESGVRPIGTNAIAGAERLLEKLA